MPGQGAIAELVRLGAGLESFVVPAAGKRPIPLELVTPGVGGEWCRDGRPRHVPMPIHVPIGHSVRDTLVANLADQPIENRRSVMVLDCCNQASVDCIIPEIVDARDLASNIADSPNKRLGLAGNGEPACHVKRCQRIAQVWMKGNDPATFLLCNPIFEGNDRSNIADRIGDHGPRQIGNLASS
jgi:hypothetical protein